MRRANCDSGLRTWPAENRAHWGRRLDSDLLSADRPRALNGAELRAFQEKTNPSISSTYVVAEREGFEP